MALPESFGQLQSLQELWISNNQLTTLPEPKLQLKSLQLNRKTVEILDELEKKGVAIYK